MQFVGITEIVGGNDNYTFSDVSSEAYDILNDDNIRACPPAPVSHKLISLVVQAEYGWNFKAF